MNIAITEQKPAPMLVPYVESYWYGYFNVSGAGLFEQRVVPNGCIELIIHLSDDHCALNKSGGGFDPSPSFTLMGIYDRPYTVKFRRRVGVFGVRFFPDGFRNIFGVPPCTFTATYEDGIDVIGGEFDALCSRIREATGTDQRIALADELLVGLLKKNQKSWDITGMAMQLIRQKEGLISYPELTDSMPVSLRQLQREFKSNYGLRISDYMRLSRLNAINKYMLAKQASLTELAHELHFADQSHFIREFRHFVGHAPGRFKKHRKDYIINAV